MVCCIAAVLVSFSNGIAQPIRVAEATDSSDSNILQVLPDEVGTITIAGLLFELVAIWKNSSNCF